MTQKGKNKITENILKLFDLMDDESAINFIKDLESICGRGIIKESIENATDKQLISLIKSISTKKFKESPKPYFDIILKTLKEETE